jgi:hypothetical protein
MKAKAFLVTLFSLCFALSTSAQQKTEVTISLNEQFFDSLIDAIYQNSPPPEFQLSSGQPQRTDQTSGNAFASKTSAACSSVTLLRENRSVRTAVRLRDGKIHAPVAFIGNYSPPLVGCLDFSGSADTTVDLEFDKTTQKLFGRIKVNNVNIDGTAGLGGSIVARMVQSSIDKKLNPIEIINLEKLSFPFTLQNQAKLRMHAVGVRYEVVPGALKIIISYEFVKD